MRTAGLLRRSAGLAIELTNRYRSDIFLRTKLHVIALQVVFGISIVIVFWVALGTAQENISTAIASGITDIINSDSTVSGEDILARIQETRQLEVAKMFLISIFAAGFFGYFVSRATLSPAKNALAAQKRFISNIAHELRTPLSIIKTNAEVMLLEDSVPKDAQEILSQTVREVDRSAEIINNLLSLNAYLNPTEILLKEVDFAAVVKLGVHKIAELAASKHIDLRAASNSSRCIVLGNETALEQVTINLLRNAITHTPRNGNISVLVEPDHDGFIALTVKDSGSGIARKDIYHIFEPYYRAETSRSREKGGSGLGLTIVSEIVHMHHGKIHVDSTLGKGTTIIVQIPSENRSRFPHASGDTTPEIPTKVTINFSKRFFK